MKGPLLRVYAYLQGFVCLLIEVWLVVPPLNWFGQLSKAQFLLSWLYCKINIDNGKIGAA